MATDNRISIKQELSSRKRWIEFEDEISRYIQKLDEIRKDSFRNSAANYSKYNVTYSLDDIDDVLAINERGRNLNNISQHNLYINRTSFGGD